MRILIVLSVILIISTYSEAYNILILMPYGGLSHMKNFIPLFETLTENGHNLTIVSDYYHNSNHSNVRTVWLERDSLAHVQSLQGVGRSWTFYTAVWRLADKFDRNCRYVLENEKFQEFVSEQHRFDVILIEFFLHECFLGVVNKFNAPFIGLSSSALFPWTFQWFGTPQNPAVNPVIFMGYKNPMSFLARVENTYLQILDNLWYKYGMQEPGNELSKKYIGYEAADPHNASLILVNTHHTLHGARPLTPSIVEVGGLHVSNRKPKKLPVDIENWINNSDAGVIYFNLGSMIKSDTLPEEQRKAFARAFSKLSQRVLWKWENDTMQDKPENVMIGKWMPQFDILCHKNIKAFISHGGLLGTTEAVHCGVPIISMPQFGDQRLNSHAIENSGVGVILDLHDATEKSITEALQKVLDPRTYQNAKALSQRFRDRPLSALDTAVYWVEHVARHKGGVHMRSPSIGMPFYQYFLLDVIAFTVVVMFAVFFVLFKLLAIALGLIQRSTKLGYKQKLS